MHTESRGIEKCRALVVADSGIAAVGYVDPSSQLLRDAGLEPSSWAY